MTTTFEDARVGDRVWSFLSGWGTIKEISAGTAFPILVVFDEGFEATYKNSGYSHSADINQCLFWGEIKFTAPPMPERVKYKNVNGFKVPDISFAPVCYELYIMPAPHRAHFFETDKAGAGGVYAMRSERGICYPHTEAGKAAAIAHARAWLGEGDPWTD